MRQHYCCTSQLHAQWMRKLMLLPVFPFLTANKDQTVESRNSNRKCMDDLLLEYEKMQKSEKDLKTYVPSDSAKILSFSSFCGECKRGRVELAKSKWRTEKVGGAMVRSSSLEYVRDAFEEAGLFDLRFSGSRLTWSNRVVGPRRICCKLDQAMVNMEWIQSFDKYEAQFLEPGISDHSPILVWGAPSYAKPCQFKILNFWAQHPGFHDVVSKTWDIQPLGSPMYVLVTKLKEVKRCLRKWAAITFGNVSEWVRRARADLCSVQSGIQADPKNEPLHLLEKTLAADLGAILRDEESCRGQQSRMLWLHLGDQNNEFFYNSVCSR
ncbi:hypothetical protein HHK36_009007 [Tetracentron sinense]|uniref:Uncharacterized protein n=1 Tax=Tetracentron sinense TaxID=13715 RepID=A0A834ZCA9_TETSI|nr:hypothetical protein HHK36_009007 [Tetracentron sinense]